MFNFFRTAATEAPILPPEGPVSRRSSGLSEFMKRLAGEEQMRVLDLGPTSSRNIMHFTGMGHSVYNDDVLQAAQDPQFFRSVDGKTQFDVETFLASNLMFDRREFDAVLCWDVPDYLPEPLVKPLVERIHKVLRPGGVLLSFFHNRESAAESLHYRFHLAGNDTLQLQRGGDYRLQRVFQNRHVENLFRDYASLKFFLARDQFREVLVVR